MLSKKRIMRRQASPWVVGIAMFGLLAGCNPATDVSREPSAAEIAEAKQRQAAAAEKREGLTPEQREGLNRYYRGTAQNPERGGGPSNR
jgi:hypothetical protein